jgi:propanol-preferring alcohol dehydrogenase
VQKPAPGSTLKRFKRICTIAKNLNTSSIHIQKWCVEMKAARYYMAGEQLRIEDIPIPKIDSNEVLIKVRSSGICHTDLHFIDGTLKPWKGQIPLTLGHEISGDIVEIGDKIKNYKKGDRVALSNSVPCGKCRYCQAGKENLCLNLDQIGFTLDGGYAEYCKTVEQTLVKLPNNMSYETASVLTCAAASCYHALVDIANAKKGETLLLNGFGGLGSNALQIAKALELEVIAVDVVDKKLQMAKDLGAMDTVNAAEQKVDEEVKKLTKNEGVDIALELVGISSSMDNAFRSLRRTGRFIFVGYTKDKICINPLDLVVAENSIKGSVAYTKSNLEKVIELASEGKISPVITKKYPLTQLNEALELMRKGKIIGRAVAIP